jgi:hypothetical protein
MTGAFGDTPLGLTSQIFNIAAILTRKAALKVPRYQRPYTWSEREVRDLIQDLWRAFKRNAPFYFIGQIVLVKNHGKLEISDGQQRLATLTMIFAYVRDRLPARAQQFQSLIMDGDNPRLILREEDSSFYRGYVQEAGKMAALAAHVEIGIDSKDLLCAAARTIDTELKSIDDKELDRFMSYVARSCTLNVVDADERGCAQTVFNTLNKRGSPLSGADIIKSDLIENSKLSDAEADAAARKWEQIEDMFERENFAKLLYMIPFLLTGERLLSPGDLAAFRAAIDKAEGGVRGFLFDQLPRFAYALRSIFACAVDVGPASTEVNRRIKMMSQVEAWDWAPAAIAFLAEHSGEPERARRFFQALDRFTFACELSVIDNRLQEGRYARAVKHCGDDKQLYGPRGALELTDAEHLKFIATLNKSRKRDRQRRLLLIRLEAALKNGNLLNMTDDVTVEHILPKAGGAWWNDRFPDAGMRTELANLIGNLTLISLAQNTEADTKPYPEKRRIFLNTPGVPVHGLTKDIESVEEWTRDVIERRHERLVRILCEDWGLVRRDESKAA